MNSDLDSLARSYARLARDVVGRIEFACDLDSPDALSVAEREKDHLDQAFFVLTFSALERNITLLASARLTRAERHAAMRDAPFEKRLDSAIRVAREALGTAPGWASDARPLTIINWYAIRNEIAHGNPPTQLFDIPPVLGLANEVAATLERVKHVVSA